MLKTSLIAGAVAGGFLLFAAGTAKAQEQDLPPGPNRALVYGQCRTCHDLQYLKESAGIPRDAWDEILVSMKQYGLRIPDDQRAKILDYLGSYLGPNPPLPVAETPPASAPAAADGAALFNEQCSACHQPNGQGVAEQFPPLAGNRDLFLSATFPATVLLAGLEGAIEVDGKRFDGAMPSFNHLSDPELAALVNYVRAAWGNDKLRPAGMAPLDAAAVAQLRNRAQVTPAGVLAARAKLKAAAK